MRSPGLGGSNGPDPVTGFDAGKREVVKNVGGPMGLTTPDNLAPSPTGAGVRVGTGPPDPYSQGDQGIYGDKVATVRVHLVPL